MKKGVDFRWTQQCQQAFDELKHRLMSGPILALPLNDETYILDTDASDSGVGAVLSQPQSGVEKVIAMLQEQCQSPRGSTRQRGTSF